MPNSQTPASRRSRAANANRWVQQQVDAGAYRLSVLLPPESAAALDRLVAVYGSKRAAIVAAIQNEGCRMNEKESAIKWHMENCVKTSRNKDGSYSRRATSREEAENEVDFRAANRLPLTGWGPEPRDVE